jgi:hypothetical protein
MTSTDATTRPRGLTRLAPLAVRLAAAWILVGAAFKLFLGTPNDLPGAVRGLLPDLVLTYQVLIAIECAVSALALLRPKHGWWLVAGAYLVFEAVLVSQLAAGEASCGCFGSKVPMTPGVMMAIDTVLLGFVLVTQPWKLPGRGAPWWLVLVLMAAGVALPFALDREVTAPPAPAAGGDGPAPVAAAPVGRGFVSLDVEEWVGKPIDETPLAQWIEGGVEELPFEGLWVLYRSTCDHCALHLEHLAQSPPETPFITLVRLKERHDTEANRKVAVLPEGDHVVAAACPATVDYVVTTPAEIWLEGGVVVRAEEGVEVE